MTDSSQPVIKVTQLEQLGIVVRDIDKTMERLWKTFGIGPWNVNLRDPASTRDGEILKDLTYYGKPATFSFITANSQKKVGGVFIELVQPTQGVSVYSDFLKEHGEGVQHLGWHLVESLEAMNETKRALEGQGFPCITSGRLFASAFALFDTTGVLKNVLEVVWRDSTKRRPPPHHVYPG